MGINTFSIALSGLATNSQGLNVVGNNLANLNTVGYKTRTITFTDVFAETASGTNGGLGAQVENVSSQFTQGGIEVTNNATDVAIQGDGFFVVGQGAGKFFTRAGNFHLDADGKVVTATGEVLQGYVRNPTTGAIVTNGPVGDIAIAGGTGNQRPTSEMEMVMNFDAGDAVGATFQTTVQVYDSLGQAHTAKLDFVKTSISPTSSEWQFDVTMPHKDFAGIDPASTDDFSLITGAIASTPPAAGTMIFDNSGTLTSIFTGPPSGTPPPVANLAMPPTGVTLPALANSGLIAPNGLTWKVVSESGGLNVSGLASTSSVTFVNQNGVPPGDMNSILIQADGTVEGMFSNGLTMAIAKIPLAQFNNPYGLIPNGSGLFSESTESGSVVLNLPGEGGNGRLVGGALELSNVDLAAEFTKIISYQRGYQANARMISTTDQILQETMNLRQ